MVSVARSEVALLYRCLGPSDGWQRLLSGGNGEATAWAWDPRLNPRTFFLFFLLEIPCVYWVWETPKWSLLVVLFLTDGQFLRSRRVHAKLGDYERRKWPVWISWPLPSLGSHKLACCNSLPDGLALAGVCLYIWVLTGRFKGCPVWDLQCWECRFGGNVQPKYVYPPVATRAK